MSDTKESQASKIAESKYYCKYCLQEINQNATVCYHCSRHQNRCIQSLGIIVHVVSISGFIISIIMVMIAFSHLKEARQERIAASDAVEKAETLAASLIRVTYIQAITKSEFGDSLRLKKAGEIIDEELNHILEMRFPDIEKRKAFIQELTKELPPRGN